MSSTHTGIEWTDKTWNPTTGCDKVSPGCLHCYAEALTQRFPKNFPNGFALTLHPERLEQPLRWRTPSRIFVNSMSDLFHKDVPLDFIRQVFSVIDATPWHVYQILTKRHERLDNLSSKLDFPQNIWLGVSVENQNYVERLEYLRPMQLEWAEDIRDQCQNAGVAFFFKQVGGRTPKAGGRLLDNQIWDEMPNAWNQHIQKWGTAPLKSTRHSGKLKLIA